MGDFVFLMCMILGISAVLWALPKPAHKKPWWSLRDLDRQANIMLNPPGGPLYKHKEPGREV